MILAVLILASFASAQNTPGQSRIPLKKDRPAANAAPIQAPAPTVAPPPAPEPVVLPPEQAPAHTPVISWDGKLLTVDADNSTLTDILQAIRARTGASMEFPSSAASERVALHIGPAPPREVVSSLLYGTNFDYVIEAQDDDPDALRSVVLTARGGGDDDGATVAAAPGSNPGVRMMRGWAAPGKTNFQAAAEAEQAAQAAEDGGAAAVESAATQRPAPDPSSAGADAGKAGDLPASASTNQSPASSSPDGSTIAVSDIPPTQTTASDGSTGPPDETSQKVQDMMHMFEQRRQIQEQQNQASATPRSSN
jgi:hypothetical protein